MAEEKAAPEQELDDEGNPITPEAPAEAPASEGGGAEPPKKDGTEGEEPAPAEEPPKPQVRKSVSQHIIKRQSEKIQRDKDNAGGEAPAPEAPVAPPAVRLPAECTVYHGARLGQRYDSIRCTRRYGLRQRRPVQRRCGHGGEVRCQWM